MHAEYIVDFKCMHISQVMSQALITYKVTQYGKHYKTLKTDRLSHASNPTIPPPQKEFPFIGADLPHRADHVMMPRISL